MFYFDINGNFTISNNLILNGDIIKNSSIAPTNSNCIGYSQEVFISGSGIDLTFNTETYYLSLLLPNAGTYDCNASVCIQFGYDYVHPHDIYFSISLGSTYADNINKRVFHKLTNPFNAYNSNGNYIRFTGTNTLFARRILTVSAPTTIYLTIYCGPGDLNSQNLLLPYTYLNYIRIA